MSDKRPSISTAKRTPSTLIVAQHLVVLAVSFFIVMDGVNGYLVTVNARRLFTAFLVVACLVIGIGRWRNSRLLVSRMDPGWLALVGLTGLSVITALYPRRSVETWLPTLASPLPIFYAALYVFRRGWPERAIFRALLAVGGYLYLLATVATLGYLAHWLSLRSQGVTAFPFRLWGVLDNPALLAMFVAIATPCWVGYLPTVRNRVERVLGIIWLCGAALTTLATATRSATIALLIGSAVALVLASQAHPRHPLARVQHWISDHKHQARVLGALLAGGLIGLFYVESRAPGHATEADRFDLYQIALRTFIAHPLTGQGPGGFILAEEQAHSLPPFLLAPHAHDTVLNLAADSGMLGLVGFGVLVICAIWTCLAAWKAQVYSRSILAGLIGGLIGFLACGLLDYPMNQPSLFGLATLLLAMIAARTPVRDRLSPMMRLRATLAVVTSISIACVAVVTLVLYIWLWNASDSARVINGDTTINWGTVASQLDTLTQTDPSDPLLNGENAYDWAQAAEQDTPSNQTALQAAIDRYQRAISLDPLLSIHYVNLATLYSRAGQPYWALHTAQTAVSLADQDSVTWLTLGIQDEAAGQDQSAITAYLEVLKFSPDWSGVGFWQTSADRRTALNAYSAQLPADPTIHYIQFNTHRFAGDADRASGQTEAAIHEYEAALAALDNNVNQAVARGLIALSQRQWEVAQAWLSEEANSGDGSILNAEAWRYLGEIAEQRGNRAVMIYDYVQSFELLTAHGLAASYAVNSFWRLGDVSQYLPDVLTLDIDPGTIPDFLTLAEALRTDGNMRGEILVYKTILRSNPTDASTLAALCRATF